MAKILNFHSTFQSAAFLARLAFVKTTLFTIRASSFSLTSGPFEIKCWGFQIVFFRELISPIIDSSFYFSGRLHFVYNKTRLLNVDMFWKPRLKITLMHMRVLNSVQLPSQTTKRRATTPQNNRSFILLTKHF